MLTLAVKPTAVFAQEKASGASASLIIEKPKTNKDIRAKKLKAYLEKYNSPLAPSAQVLVEEADKNKIDWKLIAAISGVESTFCHHIPYQSNNCWGWGVYGDNVIVFKSYDEGIITISKTLKEQYMEKWGAKDIYKIGRYYAASPTWATHVDYFMKDIDKYTYQEKTQDLSITL